MKKLKSIIFIPCSLILFILFVPQIIMSQEYTVGGDFDYAPFSYINKSGKAQGMDIDIMNAISLNSGISFNYKLSEWDTAFRYIKMGETDIITGIVFSEEREKYLDFTYPIHSGDYSIFIRKDLPFNNISDLYNYKLMVLNGDISIDKFLIPMGLYENYIAANSLPDALAGLEYGRADYVIAPYSVGTLEIEKNKYKNIEVKEQRIIPSIYCMAVKKGNTHLLGVLNKGISELRTNGELDKIQSKWMVYNREDLKFKQYAKYFIIVIFTILGLLILVLVWVWQLRRKVKQKTENLNFTYTELQASEQKFRSLAENSSDIIWQLDKDFNLIYISPADERIRGFKKEEIIGHSVLSILNPEGIKLLTDANAKRIADKNNGILRTTEIYELEQICKDGSYVWVEATAIALYDNDGEVVGYHGVSRDISNRKETVQLLKEKEKYLSEIIRTKDKLFSIIAHDLRSPFNSMLGFSDLLKNGFDDYDKDKKKKYINIINEGLKNTFNLLENLLYWSKAHNGSMEFNPKKINLKQLYSELNDLLIQAANSKFIILKSSIPEDVFIHADRDMLSTIIRNLISNAIKFTPKNGEVSISTNVIESNNCVEIVIADNGVGISKDMQSKLFDVGENPSTKGTDNESGTGLGLMLCKEFVDKHNGEIMIESELGKGSKFKLFIPCNN